jgi:hypothetical protein
MNPRVGQSVDRVYELAELYGEITVDAARRMVAIWRDADRAPRTQPQHESVAWRTAAENARRALSEVSRPKTDDERQTGEPMPNVRALR